MIKKRINICLIIILIYSNSSNSKLEMMTLARYLILVRIKKIHSHNQLNNNSLLI